MNAGSGDGRVGGLSRLNEVRAAQLVNLTNSRVPKETSPPEGARYSPVSGNGRGRRGREDYWVQGLTWGGDTDERVCKKEKGKRSASAPRKKTRQDPEREMLSDGTFEALTMLSGGCWAAER